MKASDKIEKRVVLQASQSRVWKALTDANEFSAWFGIALQGEFAPGSTVKGTLTETINEEMIMEHQRKAGIPPSKIKLPGHNFTFCTIERMEPETYFSFRWIPYGIDAEADPKNEPTTLVEFHLEKLPQGTQLTIVESGFEKVPAHRRERAFRMNDGGWSAQTESIKKYVESR